MSYRRPEGESGLWNVDGNQLADLVDVPVATDAPPEEELPAASVSDARAAEGEAVEFTVSLSAASGEEVTVDYATSDGTAESGTDFTAASGTLTFAANTASQTVRLETTDDSADEEDETFTLTLSNPAGATLDDAEATGTIEDDDEARDALTAAFRDVPAEPGGRGSEFSFELRFSENFPGRLDYKVLRDEALQATNARVTGAKRAAQGQNQRWIITVRPRSSDDVTVSLSATADCGAAGAVCTPDGRPLSNSPSARVTGPVGISVADPRVEEAAGAVLAFAVTLSRAATSALSVDYATSDGSALASEDYTAASRTLSL